MNPTVFLGLDPGATGGLAALCGSSVSAITMPRSLKALWEFFNAWPEPKGVVAAMEQVGGYIGGGPVCPVCKQPKNKSPGSAMFSFGQSFGHLEMALVGHGIEFTKGFPGLGQCFLVPPQTWQRGLRIDPKRKSESDTDWKNRLKANAEAHFPRSRHPNLPITLRTADALLLGLFIKHEYTGTPVPDVNKLLVSRS